ncbi:MAG: DUF4258 domain-containing protein [Anaerolineae bacterium]
MTDIDPQNLVAVLQRGRDQARSDDLRITQHAHQEMVAEDITLDHLKEAIRTSELLENYPQHQRGACCLLAGQTSNGHPLHAVCTTTQPVLIVITV